MNNEQFENRDNLEEVVEPVAAEPIAAEPVAAEPVEQPAYAQTPAPNYSTSNYVPPVKPQPNKQSSGLAIASMVLGIVGIVACCCCGVGLPCAIVGLILGIVARARGNRQGFSIAGIILCSFALLIGVAFNLIYWLAVFSELEFMLDSPEFFDYYEDFMYEYYGQFASGIRTLFK